VPITSQTTITGYALCVVLQTGGGDAGDAVGQVEQTAGLTNGQAASFVAAAQTTICQH
jgi:Protein of unknown function (DUF732)